MIYLLDRSIILCQGSGVSTSTSVLSDTRVGVGPGYRARLTEPVLAVLMWGVVVVSLSPLTWLAWTALSAGLPEPSLANFREVLQVGGFVSVYINSLIVVSITTVLTVSFGTTAGYTLARTRARGTQAMGFWIILVRMAPPMGFALPFFLVFQRSGMLDTYPALVLVYLTVTLPFSTWLMAGYFRGLPVELEEAARIDGCNRIQALWRVVLPSARPGIATSAIFAFIMSWNEFFYPLVVAGRETRTATVAVQGFVSSAGIEFGQLSAAAITILIPVFIFTAFTQRGLVSGLTHGSVK